MYLYFEFLFYLAVVALIVGAIALLWSLFQRSWKTAGLGAIFLFVGVLALAAPAIYMRVIAVDLGPRDEMVDGDRHVTLTGWDRESYAILLTMPDVVVLQMANEDVSDQTLDLLADAKLLRELDLNDSQVSDAGLAKLSSLESLENLKLRATKITDAGFREHIMPLPKLSKLDLRETQIRPETIQEWKESGERRRVLR